MKLHLVTTAGAMFIFDVIRGIKINDEMKIHLTDTSARDKVFDAIRGVN